jgi:outer membrane protein TolC
MAMKRGTQRLTRLLLLACVLCAALAVCHTLPAQEETEAPATEELQLTLRDAIELALENNLGIRIERITPQISERDIEIAVADFDPTLSFDSNFSQLREGTFSILQGATLNKTDLFTNSLSLTKRFTPGTTVDVTLAAERFMSNSEFVTLNPYWDSDLTITVSQPLLRNFGTEVNESFIHIAEHTRNIDVLLLRLQILSTMAEVERLYWELIFAINDLKVKEKSLQLAANLLRENEIRVKNEVLAQIEVTRARAGYQERETDVIRAKNSIKSAEDALRRILNIPNRRLTEDYTIAPLDQPTTDMVAVDTIDSIAEAFEKRPDYVQFEELLRSQAIERRFNKNQLLPELNFQTFYNANGLNGEFGGGLRRLTDGDTYDYGVGIQVQIPIGNRRARNEYEKSRLAIRKTELQREDYAQDIVIQIKEAARNIGTNLELIKSTEQSVTYFEEQLEAEEKKVAVGISTSLDVLDAQSSLAEAESLHLRAIIDYNIALTSLEEAKGTLMEKWGLEFEKEKALEYNEPRQ